MGAKQEAAVQAMMDAWGGGKKAPDVDKICAAFAEDGYWTLYMPGGPKIQGREAIRAEILRQMTYVQFPECNTWFMTSSDNIVMTEREDHFTKAGVRIRHSLCAVFELNEKNEITAWREYFDVMDVAKQTNSDPDKLSGLE
jgi:limonene-1,2-epoxide hydrolase